MPSVLREHVLQFESHAVTEKSNFTTGVVECEVSLFECITKYKAENVIKTIISRWSNKNQYKDSQVRTFFPHNSTTKPTCNGDITQTCEKTTENPPIPLSIHSALVLVIRIPQCPPNTLSVSRKLCPISDQPKDMILNNSSLLSCDLNC